MKPEEIVAAAKRLGCHIFVDEEGPGFRMPPRTQVNDAQMDAIAKLRRVLTRHRDQVVRYLGYDPANYKWVPAEGSEERKWYDFIESCIHDEPGIYEGQSGKRWNTLTDAKRLIESCRNTEQWRKEARCFWWDCTHAVASWKSKDYDWPLLSK
jgi:hypothetical protein